MMVTNMDVDLRELFVMPSCKLRPKVKGAKGADPAESASLMDLAEARKFFGDRVERGKGAEPANSENDKVWYFSRYRRIDSGIICISASVAGDHSSMYDLM